LWFRSFDRTDNASALFDGCLALGFGPINKIACETEAGVLKVDQIYLVEPELLQFNLVLELLQPAFDQRVQGFNQMLAFFFSDDAIRQHFPDALVNDVTRE